MDEVELFESVPNFSEGRDRNVIDAVAAASSPLHMLDVDPDPDHHRVVISLAGVRERLLDGLVNAIARAAEKIDFRQDVKPIVESACLSCLIVDRS